MWWLTQLNIYGSLLGSANLMMIASVLFALCSSISDVGHLKMFQPDIIQKTENLIRNSADCGDDCVEVRFCYER